MWLPHRYTPELFDIGVTQLLQALNYREHVYLRPTIYIENGRYDYRIEKVTTGMYIAGFPVPRNDQLKGTSCIVSTWTRFADSSGASPRIKAGANYQNVRFPRIEAQQRGVDDAILLNHRGTVAELTGAALFASLAPAWLREAVNYGAEWRLCNLAEGCDSRIALICLTARRRNCIVPGTAAALGGVACDPGEKAFPPGDGIDITDASGKLECRPLCRAPATSDPDGDGFGYEHEQSCIVSASVPALQGVPCDALDLTPPPRPPPPGEGWQPDYTATMFGENDCAAFGFDDPGDSDLNRAACVSTGAVKLDAKNQIYFGATGDLASLWSGPPCSCQGTAKESVCRTPPACPNQGNCGQCVEVTCNGEGRFSFQNDGVTHSEFCRPGRSVVVQLLDACPHNHPNNAYWCTRARPNHIDVSCSAFRQLTQGRDIWQIGSINVYARAVDCSVGLGPKSFR